MKHGWRMVMLVMLGWAALAASAQEADTCSGIVQAALDNLATYCAATDRNQACYAHPLLTAEPQSQADPLNFDSPGDIEELSRIRAIHLTGAGTDQPIWGVGLLRLQANLPQSLPGAAVTILLFGENTLEAAGETPREMSVSIQADGAANIRAAASSTGGVITSLASGTALTANGRNEAGDWIRVVLPDGRTGWIAAFLLDLASGNPDDLLVSNSSESAFIFKAFHLSSGVGTAACQEMPPDGILIQTPEGAGEIEFLINEVHIELGSTAFIQAAGDVMAVYLLEGHADISALGQQVTVPAGAFTTIALDESGSAASVPSAPQPYEREALLTLPAAVLPQSQEIARPAIEYQITRANGCILTLSGDVTARVGPGADYLAAATFSTGAQPLVSGQALDSEGQTWWSVGSGLGYWIRADLVTASGYCDAILVVEDLPPLTTLPRGVVRTSSARCANTIYVRSGAVITISDLVPVPGASGSEVVSTFLAGTGVIHEGPGEGTAEGITWDFTWGPSAPGIYRITVTHRAMTVIQPTWANEPLPAGHVWSHDMCFVNVG